MQSACGYGLRHQRIDAWLSHWASAGADLIDLDGVDIDSPDIVPVGGQASRSHGADIAETDHCNLHERHLPRSLARWRTSRC